MPAVKQEECRNLPRSRSQPCCINCATLPEQLICSELFGAERGAFSGADRAQLGAFRASSGGTLFLDEVADAPPQVQVALLRALETRAVRPVGCAHERPVRLRVVAATSRPIHAMMQAGSFRHDLYFRLAGFEFIVPALQDRRHDFEPLCIELLRDLGHSGRIEPAALAHLQTQAWPGNVRQLRQHLQRTLLRAVPNTTIQRHHLGAALGTFLIGGRALVGSEQSAQLQQPTQPEQPEPEQLTVPEFTHPPQPNRFPRHAAPQLPRHAAPQLQGLHAECQWLRGCLTDELIIAAAQARKTGKLHPPPLLTRRTIRTWQRTVLLTLLLEESRDALPAELSRRVGRLFHSGWYLAEEGAPVNRLARALGIRGSEERLRTLVEVLVGRG